LKIISGFRGNGAYANGNRRGVSLVFYNAIT
jgi:hypothetical protein